MPCPEHSGAPGHVRSLHALPRQPEKHLHELLRCGSHTPCGPHPSAGQPGSAQTAGVKMSKLGSRKPLMRHNEPEASDVDIAENVFSFA